MGQHGGCSGGDGKPCCVLLLSTRHFMRWQEERHFGENGVGGTQCERRNGYIAHCDTMMDAPRYVLTLQADSAEDDALLGALRRLPTFRRDFKITKQRWYKDAAWDDDASNALPAFYDRASQLRVEGAAAVDAIHAVLSDAPDAALQGMVRAQAQAADRVREDKEAHFLRALYAQTAPGPSYALLLRRPPWPVAGGVESSASPHAPAHCRGGSARTPVQHGRAATAAESQTSGHASTARPYAAW